MKLRRAFSVVLATALLLPACGPKAPDPEVAPEPPVEEPAEASTEGSVAEDGTPTGDPVTVIKEGEPAERVVGVLAQKADAPDQVPDPDDDGDDREPHEHTDHPPILA